MRSDIFYFMRKNSVDVLRYLPQFLQNDAEFKNIQDALSREHENYRLRLVDIAKQFFVETATWGVADWEQFLKIAPAKDSDLEKRRAVVRAKRRADTVMTLANTKLLLEDFAPRGEVEIQELGENRLQLIMHNGTFYWDELMAALWEMLPAHLAFDFDIHRQLYQTLNVAQLELQQGNNTFDILNTAKLDQRLAIVSSDITSGSQRFDIENNNITSHHAPRFGVVELIHGTIRFDADIETPDEYTIVDFERYIRKRWLAFKNNPVVEYYSHNTHDAWDGEIDDEDDEEFFPVDQDFLRIYWKFDCGEKANESKYHLRYQTLLNPRLDIESKEIHALSEIGAAGKILLHSKRKIPTTGIIRALYIKKHTEKIL